MKRTLRPWFAGLVLVAAACSTATAQEGGGGLTPAEIAALTEAGESFEDFADFEDEPQTPYEAFMATIDWRTEGTGQLGGHATLEVPPGYRFTGSPGTRRLMEAFGNLVSGEELGFIAPDDNDADWFAVFEFEPVGYVKDDEREKLNASKLLKELRAGQEQANEQLREMGQSTLEVVGWQREPFYNETTRNLEWALRLRDSEGNELVNYKTKILGRRGVMDVVLVCSEEELAEVVPEYQRLLAGFSYLESESYAAYEEGDPIAKYGLTGLILGGGLLAAAKSGLLGKLWKPIAAGLVLAGLFIKRIFTGRTKEAI